MVLHQNNSMSNNQGTSGNRGDKIALWGSLLSTLGDALQTVGGAISIEEGLISDAEQQRKLDQLQSQIDALKKEQQQNNMVNTEEKKRQQDNNMEDTLNQLVDKLMKRLDEETKKKSKDN